jgi:hypothetical protein
MYSTRTITNLCPECVSRREYGIAKTGCTSQIEDTAEDLDFCTIESTAARPAPTSGSCRCRYTPTSARHVYPSCRRNRGTGARRPRARCAGRACSTSSAPRAPGSTCTPSRARRCAGSSPRPGSWAESAQRDGFPEQRRAQVRVVEPQGRVVAGVGEHPVERRGAVVARDQLDGRVVRGAVHAQALRARQRCIRAGMAGGRTFARVLLKTMRGPAICCAWASERSAARGRARESMMGSAMGSADQRPAASYRYIERFVLPCLVRLTHGDGCPCPCPGARPAARADAIFRGDRGCLLCHRAWTSVWPIVFTSASDSAYNL